MKNVLIVKKDISPTLGNSPPAGNQNHDCENSFDYDDEDVDAMVD